MPTDKMGVISRDVDILEEPSRVLSRAWWHSSNNSDIYNDPNTIPIHLGSRKAAEQRFETMHYRYLYMVRMRPNARVSPQIFIESEYYDPGHKTMAAIANKGEIVRYINNSEEAGGVSLLTAKYNFESQPSREVR